MVKVKTLDEEGQKAVANMIENGYVLADEVDTELPTAIDNPDTKAEMAIPYGTPDKEIKLHKRSLKQLLAERASLEKKFTVRNGGMRGLPQSVRKRIERLENVINYKSAILKRAIEKNESGSVSEES